MSLHNSLIRICESYPEIVLNLPPFLTKLMFERPKSCLAVGDLLLAYKFLGFGLSFISSPWKLTWVLMKSKISLRYFSGLLKSIESRFTAILFSLFLNNPTFGVRIFDPIPEDITNCAGATDALYAWPPSRGTKLFLGNAGTNDILLPKFSLLKPLCYFCWTDSLTAFFWLNCAI